MTHFLRYNNRTIVDVDVTKDDLSCVVCISEYSQLLLRADADKQHEVIADFDRIQEIRGEWHECACACATVQEHINSAHIDKFVETILRAAGNKYGLQYVTD